MRNRNLLLISLLTLLAALSVHAQTGGSIRAKIPFAFSAGGKQFPAGQYDMARLPTGPALKVTSEDGKNSAMVMILTRTSGAIHNTPADAHLVFDKVGETYILAEFWLPGFDGFVLNTLKDQHEHRVVDIPVK
jgi:hypothetical protein